MRRLVRDAVLVAVTALAVWFVRGDAQQSTPLGYGEPFQLTCAQGEVHNATIEQTVQGYGIRWTEQTTGANRIFDTYAIFAGCAVYPDLRTPTPTP